MTTGSKKKYSFIIALMMLCLSTNLLWAKNTVEIQLDRNRLTTNDVINCEVTVTLTDADKVKDIKMPDFKGFNVLDSRQSSQHSTTVINFKMTSSKITTTTTLLAPTAPGSFTIGPASFMENGRRVISNSVRVQVVDVDTKPVAGDRQTSGEDGIRAELSPSEQTTPDMFLRFIPEREELMIGEQMPITLYIYYANTNPQNLEQVGAPTFPGFTSEQLEMPQNKRAQNIALQNRRYRVQPLVKFLLTARSVGEQTIPTYRLKINVSTGSFFNNRAVYRSTDALKINVLPLPEEGQPVGFNQNHVGTFRFSAKVDRRRTEVGQPVTFNLVLTGNSNMDRIQLPKLHQIENVKIYPPTEHKDSNQRGEQVVGRRTAEYLLVPNKIGRFVIPSLVFTYYDSSEKQYKVAKSREFQIQVTKSTVAKDAASGQYIEKQTLELKEGSLRPLVPAASLTNRNGQFFSSATFNILLYLPLFIIGLFLLFDTFKSLAPRFLDRETLRKQAEIKQLRLQIEQKRSNPDKSLYSDISHWIYLELEAVFGENMSGLTHDALADRLILHNVAEKKIKRLIDVFNTCEMALYTSNVLDSGGDIINKVEHWLKEVRS